MLPLHQLFIRLQAGVKVILVSTNIMPGVMGAA